MRYPIVQTSKTILMPSNLAFRLNLYEVTRVVTVSRTVVGTYLVPCLNLSS